MKIVKFAEFKADCAKNNVSIHDKNAVAKVYPNECMVKIIMSYSGLTFTYKNGESINVEEN